MNTCRCGHGRHQHRRAATLSGWERGRGTRRRADAWVPCQAPVPVDTARPQLGARPCPCRNWHPLVQL